MEKSGVKIGSKMFVPGKLPEFLPGQKRDKNPGFSPFFKNKQSDLQGVEFKKMLYTGPLPGTKKAVDKPNMGKLTAFSFVMLCGAFLRVFVI